MPVVVFLNRIRKKCNLTRQQLAQLCDRSPDSMAKFENHQAEGMSFETLNQLCKIIGGDVDDVLIYMPKDIDKLDDTLLALSRKWRCSITEILLDLPEDLRVAYQEKYGHRLQ